MPDDPILTFRTQPLQGFEGAITRRDPSPVALLGDQYHIWYSHNPHAADGYSASVWHATSLDGLHWTETGEALPTGPTGAFDEHGVFTPTILPTPDKLYLIYTAVPEPFTNDNGGPRGTKTAIGIATATDPDGPWERRSDPILRPTVDPELFDSHRVDDCCVVVRDGRYWLYYKGRQAGHTPGETKMGCAVADAPDGPYARVSDQPVLASGHEVCVWPQDDGVMALISPAGPEGRTLQFARDGLHFERLGRCNPPSAPGPFRADGWRSDGTMTLTWGVSQETGHKPPQLRRWELTSAPWIR